MVISAPNDDLKLKPGLTANVTIYTLEMKDVLAVSAKALRFNPTEAMLNEGETITPTEARTKLWVKQGNNLKARPIETGITNGTLTQVLSGVSAGTEVLADVQTIGGMEEEDNQGSGNPFMPRPKKKDEKKK